MLSRRFAMLNLPELHQLAEAGMCIRTHLLLLSSAALAGNAGGCMEGNLREQAGP